VSHRLTHNSLSDRLKVLVPFGLGQTNPNHFRDMLAVAWKNRDNLGYAWKVLSQGVCDGCALGVAGFHDWTLDPGITGVHLCMTRLNLLRLNTMPPMDHALLGDVSKLRGMSNQQLRELGRLAYPMLRRRGDAGFARVSWEEAIRVVADRIRGSDPKRLAFYLTSRGITNEVYYVAQKAARFLGTNNIDNAARLCHSPSTGAMKATLGVAASTCSYRDWYGTDLIVFFGSNPANDQPVATKYLKAAKQRGTKVVMVNPYCEPGMRRYYIPSDLPSALFGTPIADYWFGVAQGGDVAMCSGVLKILMENGWVDAGFIEQHSVGFEHLKRELEATTWEQIEAGSGLSRDSLREFAELLRDARDAVFVWSMGITQHAFGGDAVQAILNLGLARGYIGREKNGLMPIRGHSGVQGGAEMGAYATAFPGGKPINKENASALSSVYGFAVPDRPGITAAEMVEAAHDGELDLLYCAGGNFLRTLPDPRYVAEAMARVPLRVHQDIIVTDQMLIDSATGGAGGAGGDVLLLPAQTRYEQEGGGTETTTERRVCFSPQIPRTVGDARAEWRIFRDIAAATDPERAHLLGCETGQQIREEIARVVPNYDGIQHFRETGDSFQYGGARLCEGGKFNTVDGKAHFRAVALPTNGVARRNDNRSRQFKCSTRRGKQFNSIIYAETDPLTGAPRDAVFISPEDAADLHLRDGEPITLVSEAGRFDGRAFFAPIARGNLQVHWPEGNVLLCRGVLDELGGVPDYNAVVWIEK
jgi:molybdopterin-dependent oxidoreductase alpha subunit